MAIPPNIKARLEQLKMEAAVRAQQQQRQAQAQQNAEKMSKQFVPGKAGGGLTEFLKDSAVKHPVYHASPSGDIKAFNSWSHFGTEKAAKHIASTKKGTTTYKVHLNVKKPLRTKDHGVNQMGWWNLEKMINELTPEQVDWSKWHGGKEGLIADWKTDQDPTIVEDFLRRNGYDSIVYKNQVEDPGSDSYIVFDPRKVKSAIGNRGTYDPTNPDITKAKGGAVDGALTKFLKDSSVKVRVYHGTTSPESYDDDPHENAIRSFAGRATWVAEEPYTAHGYAGKSGYMMPLHVKIKKPLAINHVDANDDADHIYGLAKNLGVDVDHLKAMAAPESVWEVINHPYFIDAAEKAGFDGISIKEGGRQTHAVFNPGNIKSAIGNRGTYDPRNPDITKAKGGSVPSIDEMRLALNQQGMYSPLEKAAMAVPRTKGTPAEFMAEISKQPGFRAEEVADRKISLPDQKLTKAEMLAHIQKHPSPKLEEKVLGGNDYYEALDNAAQMIIGDDYATFNDLHGRDIAAAESMVNQQGFEEPRHEQYQVPGGNNYREVLLKLPQRGLNKAEQNNLMMYESDIRRAGKLDPWHQKQYEALAARKESDKQDFYHRSHWEDPNVVAHLRLSDRMGPNGEKLLHIEEVQSDWHQQGRKKGYGQEDPLKKDENGHWTYTRPDGEVIDFGPNIDADLMRQAMAGKAGAVPDAPFKKSWHELALKHALSMAAKGGYEGIAITPGDIQAERWNNPGLKVQYDKTIPEFLNKLGKKHGAKVGKIAVKKQFWQQRKNQTTDLHYFPITDSLRQQINTEGLPQYDLGGVVHKADGGAIQGTSMNPSIAQMKMALSRQGEPAYLRNIGINEAVDIDPKVYVPPAPSTSGMPAPGGVATPSGMPIGGIDMSKMTPGQQMMPMPASPQLPDPTQQGALPGAQPNPLPSGFGPQSQQQAAPNPIGGGNILQMTPQGRAMAAMSREFPPMPGQTPSNMAKGGSAKSVDEMKAEMAAKKKGKAAPKAAAAQEDDEEPAPSKRITIRAEGPGGVTGIVVPHHMWHGRSWVSKKTGKTVVVPGMKEINKARAEVYGSENRDPLSIGKMGAIHKQTLAEHFSKPLKEQLAAEKAATEKLRAAKHLGKNADTLDKSEKLDTVNHEHDAQGRTYVGFASKGVAGHALYTSGHGENEKHHILNTCPGQTEGCGGGKDAEGIVDTMRGTCFAPGAESQYVHAAVRRATHAQAKHDPAMTRDWILAHTGSIRRAAENADKHNKRLLFRPNVVDETDVSSRHVIRHLNEQRKPLDKPEIEANSYGKTNELHDPENGYHVTHSNVGPKVKKGQEISENIGRDKARVRNTVLAADNKGDFTNEQGHKTPPKGTYMVTDVKRGSKLSKDMEKAITHAKYWTTGRAEHELTEEEKAEGPEAHYSGTGRKTTEEKAHYGHRTVNGLRFDYQRQHLLHPRLVQVGLNKDGTPHMIPTDSRFKDTEFLPKNRYKTKNGKDAGHILMTTPTESTSNLGHETSFTHHVNQSHVEHALKNNGEYEIDKPEDQIKARGKEYAAPQPVKFMAEGGSVARHPGLGDDDFHAFPESNFAAQRHLAMRRGDDEDRPTKRKLGGKVAVHKDIDTMRLELTKKAK